MRVLWEGRQARGKKEGCGKYLYCKYGLPGALAKKTRQPVPGPESLIVLLQTL